ncbi:MAG: (d)CMP kinase [Congregibacter sp.]
MSAPVITVDGPGGAGKGTLCFSLASTLGWRMLDSGALYRVVAHAALSRKLAFDDELALATIAGSLNVSFLPAAGGLTRVVLDGDDISLQIRTEACGAAASNVAALRGVRQALLERQRQMAVLPGLVADGRDMGTVVFPNAALKIYLTASARARAERRRRQLKDSGGGDTLARLLETIEERDERDQNRSESPLIPADDAIVVDSTDVAADVVLDTVLKAARDRHLVD